MFKLRSFQCVFVNKFVRKQMIFLQLWTDKYEICFTQSIIDFQQSCVFVCELKWYERTAIGHWNLFAATHTHTHTRLETNANNTR